MTKVGNNIKWYSVNRFENDVNDDDDDKRTSNEHNDTFDRKAVDPIYLCETGTCLMQCH